MLKNAVGRNVPKRLFGREYLPYAGAYSTAPKGRRAGRRYRTNIITPENRRIYDDLEKVIRKVGLKDGMCLGFNHNLRYGDLVICQVMDTIASMGIKNLTLASTALFPNHEPLIEHVHSGVISEISGSLNGPIGKAVSIGEVNVPTSLRSHGGRARAVECDDLHLDVAFVASPAVDLMGNMNGCQGKSAFGANGFANETDSVYADHVVLITDNLTEEPVTPVSIRGSNVDYIVTVDKIGDPNKIVAGSLGRNVTGRHTAIAEEVITVAQAAGYIKKGFSFQAGAGGVSLATVHYLEEIMTEKKLTGSFIHGGTTEAAVELLEAGIFQRIYDGQSFDLTAVKSLKENPLHIESSVYHSYNIYAPGGPLANYVDVVALGATEIDLDFNVNVNTHSDGLLLHGIGGHTDAAAARLTIITCPISRKVPIVRDRVTTISTPGEMIDVVITNAGIAVNPKNSKLIKQLKNSDVAILDMKDLRDMAYGEAEIIEPEFTDEICTAVEYRDGTLMDVIYRVNT
ncbi:citrate lyase subunit alpha [Candidatus Heimdallarchaeota archaeon B3_Heim]|nr:MAG: citrate lyase subunit alpha [Candidatus Heimdallarchaeota archaeon B3_Heim]